MSVNTNKITFQPIGIIRTPFTSQQGTPCQPAFSGGAEGTIHIYQEFREGLVDLDGFDRIWILFLLDRSKDYKMKVIPYLDTVERGVFATRAPSRPNFIGLSAVRIVGVDESSGTVRVKDVDILDETQIIDIKPYIPENDSYRDSRTGWFEQVRDKGKPADDRFSI